MQISHVPMTILVVDDDRMIRMLLRRFLESCEHRVVEASSGEEAIACLAEANPDIVLMDMVMPGMDGIETAREIKRIRDERWIPVIFLTALDNEADLVAALSGGGDDYLTKPVNFPILRAKLSAFERSVSLNKRVHEQSAELARYQDRSREELRVAKHLMGRIVNGDKLADPFLSYWTSAAEYLSGDLLAAARTPGDVLYVMLADGVGHGLTASLNVLPVTQPFYTMTAKGFSIVEIAREINSKVRQLLPRDRFISAVLVSVDMITNRLEVWNGGIPKVYVLNQQGKVLQEFSSKHLPLGILSESMFDSKVEAMSITEDIRVLMYSDGLVEAEGEGNMLYGQERLLTAFASAQSGQETTAIQDSIVDHLQGRAHHDDISLVVLNCQREVADRMHLQSQYTDEYAAEKSVAGWTFSLELGASELKRVNAIPLLIHVLDQMEITRRQRSEIFLILTELFANALDHGLLQLDSALKESAGGMDDYFDERADRLYAMQEGRICLDLAVKHEGGQPYLQIDVRDSGPGFDVSQQPSANVLQDVKHSGKGIALVRSLCQQVTFHPPGNHVTAAYALRRKPALTVAA
ncbi:SpoIIE family protein phosphatase [Leeia oryzae]|uniref:SpoIIE family protein phosphatase n=1 Tax=Leeia oryzae TaxID=356662 RepID=UPI000399ECAB|nr:SpoIIE family protein phosphatase [Leeia oryzae]